MNKRNFLTLTESEKKSILNLHKESGYNTEVSKENIDEQLKKIVDSVAKLFTKKVISKGAKTALQSSDDISRIISKNGFDSIDDMMKNLTVLTPKDRTLVYRMIFRTTEDATERAAVASRFVDDKKFVKQFIKGTEEETVKAFKNVGKYTDEQVTALTDAWKMLTTGNKAGKWTPNVRNAGKYSNLKDMPGWSNMVAKAEKEAGKRFGKIGQGTRENLIKDFVEKTIREGGKVSWRDLSIMYKKQLMAAGITSSILISLGLYNYLKDNGVEDLPSENMIVGDMDDDVMFPVPGEDEIQTDTVASDEVSGDENYDGQLGERILRDEETPRGEDVKDLQRRLNNLYGFDLKEDGIYGPDTTSKVKEFQRMSDISVDGDFGPNSFEALLKAESGKVEQDTTQNDSVEAPENNLELMEPVLVTNIENKRQEIKDLAIPSLENVPEDEIFVVQAPENAVQSVTDKVIDKVVVRGAKKCPQGKKPVLVKSKEKMVNRKNKEKRKTVAVYRCRKI